MEDLISMTPNPERAKSILNQVEARIEVMQLIPRKHPTLIVEAQYDIIKELMTALLSIDGFKALSHTTLIDYLRNKYKRELIEQEIRAIDEFRIIRNKIAYEGFTIKADFLQRKEKIAESIISKLKKLVNKKLGI